MREKRIVSIAIDGPSAAGKSTIAKRVAAKYGLVYLDTGAIYRCVALATQRSGVDAADRQAVTALLPEISIRITYGEDGAQHMLLGEEDVTGLIRTPEISMRASSASAHPEVRAFLLELQRQMARTRSVVMDGRDIGTVVLPNADLKIFLTASAEARAKRRWEELLAKGTETTFEEVLRDTELRDYQDANRDVAPLRPAEDAVTVDTTELDLEESVAAVCRLVEDRLEL